MKDQSKNNTPTPVGKSEKRSSLGFLLPVISLAAFLWMSKTGLIPAKAHQSDHPVWPAMQESPPFKVLYPAADTVLLDTALYNRMILHLVHDRPSGGWPVETPFPLPDAVLPFKRIVAYYGNLYSPGMGILGALSPDEMLAKLQEEVKSWEDADPFTPVQPALHYVAVTAQPAPGAGGRYRLRMPSSQIDRVLEIAKEIEALVFLDIQVGHSTLQEEIPLLENYLLLPHVHIGIDPEYSMKRGQVPGSAIGTFDAADINYVSGYLAGLVREYGLPPKILIVHRFTKAMVTDYKKIETLPEVQIVMNMDGFGFPAKKINTYQRFIAGEPVQFTGFKLFYRQDTRDSRWPELMQPGEILKLYPKPIYIQYQ
ncbi:hypothetical protein [Negadavirga shengliensis]|uniref:Lipoprotein n=1 Tax=Negadavirga shengliensis TaxID=1389218 RepID=A0ABV9SZY2_9BACT